MLTEAAINFNWQHVPPIKAIEKHLNRDLNYVTWAGICAGETRYNVYSRIWKQLFLMKGSSWIFIEHLKARHEYLAEGNWMKL